VGENPHALTAGGLSFASPRTKLRFEVEIKERSQ
jgi:hypothetical protein